METAHYRSPFPVSDYPRPDAMQVLVDQRKRWLRQPGNYGRAGQATSSAGAAHEASPTDAARPIQTAEQLPTEVDKTWATTGDLSQKPAGTIVMDALPGMPPAYTYVDVTMRQPKPFVQANS